MTIRPFRYCRRRWKKIVVICGVLFVGMNILAARHAHAFLNYTPATDATLRPEQLSTGGKISLLFTGASVPRPANASDPSSLALPFTTHRIAIGNDWLELWQVPAEGAAAGTAILCPGYKSSKSSLLPEAAAYRALGFETILVDFRGAGGSSGSDTTLGIREAEDVALVVRWIKERESSRKLVLFGRSMGAAAVLGAIARHAVKPAAVVIECPFDRMLNAVRNRFGSLGVPSFPCAELLVFWGGRQIGFDGFDNNPVRDAERVDCPVLVMGGGKDARATPLQVRAVFDQLPGEKQFHLFENAGHEPFRKSDPPAWDRIVSEFLHRHVP